MAATDFTGYGNSAILFGWDTETVDVKRADLTGRSFSAVAENVKCKPDGEKQGIKITDVGAMPAYERRFFFACSYEKAGGADLALLGLMKTNDVIVDADGTEWRVESIANPGGANEHLEVLGHREPAE